MTLTDREIKAAKPAAKPYALYDERGLYLAILPSGVRAFRIKTHVNGIEKRCSLGVYPETSLKEARDKRDEVRKLAAGGEWIVDQKRQGRQAAKDKAADGKANRFGTWAERYYQHHANGWSANHARDIRRMLDKDIVPELGRIPGTALTTAHVQALIDKIVARGAITHAHDVRTYCSAIFKHANAKRPVKLENPVAYVVVPKPPKAERHAALPPDQIGRFLCDLNFADAEPITRIGMRVLLHTALRTSEMRLGRWTEIDEKARLWRVPASRMKSGVEHLVPLSDEVMALLAQLRRITGGCELMFPNVMDPDNAMSDSTMLGLLYRMGLKGKQSGHGCRRQFSTWCNENDHKPDAIERQLNHVPRDVVRASYNAADYLPQRKAMMAAWSTWLAVQEREAQNVVALRAVA